jgi:DinB superfamily
MVSDRTHVSRNDASRERLRTTVARLSADDLHRHVSPEWTVSANLAHLGFSDRQILRWFEEWERRGIRTPEGLHAWEQEVWPSLQNQNNDLQPDWLAADPREAARDAVLAAAEIDSKITRLAPALVAAIQGTSIFGRRRHWVIDRSIHREEHLAEIERAVAADRRNAG